MPYIVEKQTEVNYYIMYQSYIYEGCGDPWHEGYFVYNTDIYNYVAVEGTEGDAFINMVTALDFDLSTTPQIIRPYKIELVIWPLSFTVFDVFNVYIRELDKKLVQYAGPEEIWDDCFTPNAYVNGEELMNIGDPPLVYDLGSLVLSDLFERTRQYLSIGITTDWQSGYNNLKELKFASMRHPTVGYRPFLRLYYYDDPLVA